MYNFVAGESNVCRNWVLVSFCWARNVDKLRISMLEKGEFGVVYDTRIYVGF